MRWMRTLTSVRQYTSSPERSTSHLVKVSNSCVAGSPHAWSSRLPIRWKLSANAQKVHSSPMLLLLGSTTSCTGRIPHSIRVVEFGKTSHPSFARPEIRRDCANLASPIENPSGILLCTVCQKDRRSCGTSNNGSRLQQMTSVHWEVSRRTARRCR